MSRKKNRLTNFLDENSRRASPTPMSVDRLVMEVIESQRNVFFEKNILVETDLASVETLADTELIKAAFESLLENATDLMHAGGELTITLVDSTHQWELEVADTFSVSRNGIASNLDTTSDLPTLIPFPQSENLRKAHRAALGHGGHVQTWDCPQGGTAHVLIIPKPHPNHNRI